MAEKNSKPKRSARWEMMAHCGPDCNSCILHTDRHVSARDRERHFARVATNGVVQLFNAVNEHQRSLSHITGDSSTTSSRRASNTKKSSKKRLRDRSAGGSEDDDDAAQRQVPESERDRALGALRKSHFMRLLEQYSAAPEDPVPSSATSSGRQPRAAKSARRKLKSEPKIEPQDSSN